VTPEQQWAYLAGTMGERLMTLSEITTAMVTVGRPCRTAPCGRGVLVADGDLVTLADTNRRSLSAALNALATRAQLSIDDVEQIMDAAHVAERALADTL
jgi:hypothetical protein